MKDLKIVLLLIAFLMLLEPVKAQDCNCANNCNGLLNGEVVTGTEFMFDEKGACNNQVMITNLRNIICKGNVFKVTFTNKFWSECAKAGDRVNFDVPGAIYTKEGTLLIPACSKVVATVTRIEKQRFPNKNARVYLNFECLILPDGSAYPMNAIPLTNGGYLNENGWHTFGKLFGYTVGLGIVGAGAGTGFAFIPNPAKLGVGFAVGIPVGCTVGLITGLLTPGLKYHAKEGEEIAIILCENLPICKQCETNCIQQQYQPPCGCGE